MSNGKLVPSDLDLARRLNQVIGRGADVKVSPVTSAFGRGFVDTVANGQASIRKENTTDSTPGFTVPAGLQLQSGDFVWYYELGSDRQVVLSLDRDAVNAIDKNLLSKPGQMIFGGPDGTPTVLDPPNDPTIDYALYWDPILMQPQWETTSVVEPPAPPPIPTGSTLAASSSIGATNIKVTSVSTWAIGDSITVDVSPNAETVTITTVGTAGSGGTGISFTPAMTKTHSSGAAVVTALNDARWPKMTMWWPYWKSRSLSDVSTIADDMVYMNQRGVILMGMDWGSDYQLPSDVSAKLDIFIGKGIKPYLGLWVGHLDGPDQTVGLQAWNAGNGKWAGIVLDAENQWVQHCQSPSQGGVGEQQAHSDFNSFMSIFRPLTEQLAVACYASPTSYPNYHYDWWNSVVDTLLPLAYFNSTTDTASAILNTMYRKFNSAYINQGWANPVKPIVPVMNGYSSTLTDAQVAERLNYANIAFTNAGAVEIWRWIDTFPDNMRQMLHGISPT